MLVSIPIMMLGRSARLHPREAQMNWIMLLGPSIVSVLIVLSAYAWRDTLKTERPAQPRIEDIPLPRSHQRHSDADHQR